MAAERARLSITIDIYSPGVRAYARNVRVAFFFVAAAAVVFNERAPAKQRDGPRRISASRVIRGIWWGGGDRMRTSKTTRSLALPGPLCFCVGLGAQTPKYTIYARRQRRRRQPTATGQNCQIARKRRRLGGFRFNLTACQCQGCTLLCPRTIDRTNTIRFRELWQLTCSNCNILCGMICHYGGLYVLASIKECCTKLRWHNTHTLLIIKFIKIVAGHYAVTITACACVTHMHTITEGIRAFCADLIINIHAFNITTPIIWKFHYCFHNAYSILSRRLAEERRHSIDVDSVRMRVRAGGARPDAGRSAIQGKNATDEICVAVTANDDDDETASSYVCAHSASTVYTV